MKNTTKFWALCAGWLLLSLTVTAGLSRAVTLDTSFGQGGKVLTDFGEEHAFIHTATLLEQSDGKIIAVGVMGYIRAYAAAMRFHPDGRVDSSFGNGGKAVLHSMRTDPSPLASLDRNDRIVLAGLGSGDAGATWGHVLVARLTRDGALDSSFNSGEVVSEKPSPQPVPYGLGVDAQNRILITGGSGLQSQEGLLMRFRADGALDSSFDGDGLLFFDFAFSAYSNNIGFGVTNDAQGRILLAGRNSSGMFIARYLDNGVLDNSFAGRGFLIDSRMDAVAKIAVLDSGRIAVTAGHLFYDFAQARYLENGTRDLSFSGDGFATATLSEGESRVYSHQISSDGSVTIGATTRDSAGPHYSEYDVTIARLTPEGAFDAAFGAGGKARVSLGEGEDYLNALGVLRDKSVVFRGAGANYPYPGGVLVKLQANGSLDTTWGGDGLIASGLIAQDFIEDIAIDSQRRIVAVGHGEQGAIIARYLEKGALDLSFGEAGKTTALSSLYSYSHVVLLPDDRVLVAGSANVDGLSRLVLRRFQQDGSLDTSFGTEGTVLLSILNPPTDLYCVGLTLTGQGKIIAALTEGLARFHENGTPDNSFGDGAIAPGFQRVTSILSCSALAQDTMGRLLLGGHLNGDIVVARYNADGGLDASFGNGGSTAIDLGNNIEYVYGLALAPDGKILAGGLTEPPYQSSGQMRSAPFTTRRLGTRDFQAQASLVRLHENGRLDITFASGGKLLLPTTQARRFNDIAVDRKGRTWAVAGAQDDFAVVRVTANGQLDENFAPGGLIATDFGGFDSASALELEASGRATVAGWSDAKGTQDFALARYDDEKLAIADVTILEGNSSGRVARFAVTLSIPCSQVVTVNYATVESTAIAGIDYETVQGTLTFAPGETVKTIAVPLIGDTLDEANELFRVNLSVPVHAEIGDGQAVCIITDDDRAPAVGINDITIAEGNSGLVNALFTVSLSAASGQRITLNAVPYNGTARAPADYAGSGVRLSFAPGEVTKIFSAAIQGDTLDEANETFYVVLSAPVNVSIGRGRGLGLIMDDDHAPSLAINDVQISEGHRGQKTLTFTVALSKASGQNVSVNYATADGIARSTSDYTAKSGTLSFAPGSTLTRTISVAINGDTQVEGNETLYILLTGAVNASIGRGRGVGTITNDDTSNTASG